MEQEKSLSQLADEHEYQEIKALENRVLYHSPLYQLEDGDIPHKEADSFGTWTHLRMMGEDPRLPKMPERPTLLDFMKLRFNVGIQQHLLQSGNLAQKNGCSEKMVLACLLHDISVCGLIRSDHGYWGAQLIEPYVDEEISWAIRMHQSLRFFPDPEIGYPYPETYIAMFGEDYKPEPYIYEEAKRAKKHKWYMSAMTVCLNDLDAFDRDIVLEWDQFEDIIGRHFKQPPEGLGNDNTPSSHMWRTIRRPGNAL